MTGRTSGFTLIEVIVGLAVGGIVLLMGFGTLAAVQDRAEHAASATTAALHGATARATIIDWLSAARLRASDLNGTFVGLDAREHSLPADELIFPTRASTPIRVPTTVVRLFIDVDPETPERGLVADFIGSLTDVPRPIELAPQATGLRIRYLPASNLPVEWAESWVAQSDLPRAVEVTITDNPADPLPPLLRLPIRVPLATLERVVVLNFEF